MKKTDQNTRSEFSEIYKKFEQAAPPIPEGLHESNIKEKIQTKQTHKTISLRMPINRRALLSIAACFVLLIGALSAALIQMPLYRDAKTIPLMQSEEELLGKLQDMSFATIPSELGGDSGVTTVPTASQEDALQQPDQIQTDGEYIYYAYEVANAEQAAAYYNIYIYRVNGTDTQLVTVMKKVTDHADEINGLLLSGDRLTVFISDEDNVCSAEIYDVSTPASPQLVNRFQQSGSYIGAYMAHDTIYMVSKYYAPRSTDDAVVPESGEPDHMVPVEMQDIAYFTNAQVSTFLVISAIDPNSGTSAAKTRAVLGATDNVVCSEENLYVSEAISARSANEKAGIQIMQVKLHHGRIVFSAVGHIGQRNVKNCIIDTIDSQPVIVTTERNGDSTVNKLYVLDEDLQQTGQSADFAADMQIKQVAVTNKRAYISLEDEADVQLYTISLQSLSAPAVICSQSISNVSATLLQTGENEMLAVIENYETDGTILSLYDTSGAKQAQLLDQCVLEKIYLSTLNPIALNSKNASYAFASYTANDQARIYGITTLEVKGQHIDIANELKSNNEDLSDVNTERCLCIGNYLYNFTSNDFLPDDEKLKIHAFEY